MKCLLAILFIFLFPIMGWARIDTYNIQRPIISGGVVTCSLITAPYCRIAVTQAITTLNLTFPADATLYTIEFDQDSTGHTITLPSNVLSSNGDGISPIPSTANNTTILRMVYNTASSAFYETTSGGATTTQGIGGGAANTCGADHQCNALNFGATGNGSTDDWGALEKGYLAAYAAQEPFYIPSNTYAIAYPLVLSANSTSSPFMPIKVYGAGDYNQATGALTQLAPTGGFPAIIMVPPDYITSLGTIQVAGAISGAGNAAQFNSGKPWFIRADDEPWSNSPQAPLNSLTVLTVQLYFKATSTGTHFLYHSGSGSSAGSGAIDVSYTTGGAITAHVKFGSTIKTVTGGTVTQGTEYFTAVDVCSSGCADAGANLYLYLATPGATSQSPVAKTSVTGSITQAVAETFALGAAASFPPTNLTTTPFVGTMESFDVENADLYSGNAITAPNAHFSPGANNLYLNNFSQVGGNITDGGTTIDNVPFVSCTAFADTTIVPCYQPIYNMTYDGNARGQDLEEIGTSGGTYGIFDAMEPATFLDNITMLQYGAFGAVTFNNTYNSIWHNITGTASQGATAGLECAWFLGTVYNATFSAEYYPFEGWCGTYVHPTVTSNPNTISSMLLTSSFSAFDSLVIIDPEIDNETGGTNINGIEDNACGSGVQQIIGGTIIASGTASAILVDNANSSTTCSGLTVDGSSLWGADAIGFTNTSPAGTTSIGAFGVTNNATALSNKPEWITQSGCGGTVTLSSGTGTVSNVCIVATSVCAGLDITTPANAVTLAAPSAGSISVTGTGSDVVKVVCQ